MEPNRHKNNIETLVTELMSSNLINTLFVLNEQKTKTQIIKQMNIKTLVNNINHLLSLQQKNLI